MRKVAICAFLYIAFAALCILSLSGFAGTARNPSQVRQFRKLAPCPATGQITGACPGWVVDHIVPLCANGDDAPSNMQWQPYTESKDKDKWEARLCSQLRKNDLYGIKP